MKSKSKSKEYINIDERVVETTTCTTDQILTIDQVNKKVAKASEELEYWESLRAQVIRAMADKKDGETSD